MEFYLWIYVVAFLIFAFLGKLRCKNWMNPITLFCGVWAAIIFAYSLHLYKLYYASELTVKICIIGVVSYFIGAGIRSMFTTTYRKNIGTNDIISYSYINYRMLIFLNVLSLLLLLRFGLLTVQLLLSGHGFDYIRDMYMDEDGGSLGGSKISSYLMTFFIWPWNYALIPSAVVVFLSDKRESRYKNIFLWTSIINIAMFVLITAGRISMVYCAMYFVIVSLLMGKKFKLTRKQKMSVIILLVCIILGIAVISISRGSPEFLRNAYVYLCGCMPFCSNRLNIYALDGNVKTFGFASFRGFWMIIMIVLSKILNYPELYLQAVDNIYVQDRIFIAPGQGYNAFTTCFYYFYVDGGIPGVIIISALFGAASMALYIRMQKKQTFSCMILYCFVAFSIIFSMVRFQLATVRYFTTFIYLFICFKDWKQRGRSIYIDIE